MKESLGARAVPSPTECSLIPSLQRSVQLVGTAVGVSALAAPPDYIAACAAYTVVAVRTAAEKGS
jgi:hypothetical protein